MFGLVVCLRWPRAPVRTGFNRYLQNGALGETRTRTAYATAPSRQRVYQVHHQSRVTFLKLVVQQAHIDGPLVARPLLLAAIFDCIVELERRHLTVVCHRIRAA